MIEARQSADLREAWILQVVAECQRFSGVWLSTDLESLEHGVREFTSRLDRPMGNLEREWLRPVLLQVAFNAASQLHRYVHRIDRLACDFVPMRTFERLSWIAAPDACPVGQFTDWSGRFLREISAAHAVFAATAIAQAIREHPGQHFKTSDLSLRFNHSENDVRNSFKQLVGVSIREYQTRQRILCAIRALRDGIKADAIALGVGFKRPNKFYACFRRITGGTPASLRQKLAHLTDADLESLCVSTNCGRRDSANAVNRAGRNRVASD